MANHISHAALPYPIKGCRFTLLVPYLDSTGTPTDPTTPDTERSIDAAAFADCTEEVSTISGSNGMGYITLTGDEMNGSAIAVCAKVASGPKATLATLYPRVLPILQSGTAAAGASGTITLASGAAAIDDLYNGCIIRTTGGTGGAGGSGSLGNQARVITDYVGSTKVATISPSWETTPDNTTTYEILQAETALFTFANAVQLLGTVIATPATAGIPDVNVKNMNNVAATSITTINANQGTTQPVNFTGTGASALAKSDMVDVAGAAVSTTSAQLGVNAVNIGGTAQTGRDIGASVLLSSGTGTGQLDFTSGVVKANLAQILGTALTETAGLIAAGFKQFFNVVSPTSTMNTITTVTTATNLTNAPTAGDLTATMKASVTTAATAATPIAASVTGSVGSIATGGIAAASFAAGAIDASAIATDAIGSAELAASAVNEIADQVWDELLSGHTVSGSAGAGLTAAGSAGDPWATALPGAYGAGTAGALVGAVPTATQNADTLLNRDMSSVSDTNARSPLNALRFLRNKFSLSGTTLTVTKENDTTTAWVATVTTDSSASPITGSDPS